MKYFKFSIVLSVLINKTASIKGDFCPCDLPEENTCICPNQSNKVKREGTVVT